MEDLFLAVLEDRGFRSLGEILVLFVVILSIELDADYSTQYAQFELNLPDYYRRLGSNQIQRLTALGLQTVYNRRVTLVQSSVFRRL